MLVYCIRMLGLIFRFVSGMVIGLPVAIIAYYSLPILSAELTTLHAAFIGSTAGALGALRPDLLLQDAPGMPRCMRSAGPWYGCSGGL